MATISVELSSVEYQLLMDAFFALHLEINHTTDYLRYFSTLPNKAEELENLRQRETQIEMLRSKFASAGTVGEHPF